MGGDFFDRLDAELAELTRQGAHLTVGGRAYRRAGRLVRRGLGVVIVAVAMAAALVSEFPASASGHAQAAQAQLAQAQLAQAQLAQAQVAQAPTTRPL